jgi:hypothetical protein
VRAVTVFIHQQDFPIVLKIKHAFGMHGSATLFVNKKPRAICSL